MKKTLALLFVYAAMTLPSMAVVSTEEVMSETYIRNHGYSDEMVRLIDLQNSQINGRKPTYKNNDPEWYTSNKAVYYVRRIFMYFDPALDDQKFMDHNLEYTNTYDDL